MTDVRESREPAVHSPPTQRQSLPSSLLQTKPHHGSPISPSRKAVMAFGRPRSHSLGTAYSPLLMPQSPPPPFRGGRASSSSLSPSLRPDGTKLKVPILNRLEPPRHTDVQKVMELAMQAERKRAKEMEPAEKEMTADELRAVLKRERHRMSKIQGELAKHKSLAVQSQAEAEINEEGRVNCLMRRLDDLQIEKGRIIVQLEQEEEMLTNTLQKKLDQVRREKAQLEKLIEHEKLSHSDLQSTLTDLKGKTTNKRENDPTAAGGVSSAPVTKKSISSLPPIMASLEESQEEEEEYVEEDEDPMEEN